MKTAEQIAFDLASAAIDMMTLHSPHTEEMMRNAIGRWKDFELSRKERSKSGVELIAAERERQIKKGWNASHDDDHTNADLTFAAMAYAHEGAARQGNWLNIPRTQPKKNPPRQWPFDDYHWNPEDDAIGNLVKAGALIAAEIDRLSRMNTHTHPPQVG